jgi:hypothetical protein
MEVGNDGVHNTCSIPGYFPKPAFLSGTMPCNTYLPTYPAKHILNLRATPDSGIAASSHPTICADSEPLASAPHVFTKDLEKARYI